MADLQRQYIAVNNNNDPALKYTPVPGNIHLTQLEEDNTWIYERIILPRWSNSLHNTNAAFNNYTREEVMKMKKLELF